MGTVLGAGLGGTIGGLAFHSAGGAIGGALVGALAGNLVGRALDDQERQRLAKATQRAFVAETNEPTVYTVEPTRPRASTTTAQAAPAATVVAAKPVGPKATRTDGSTCRPIELTATKNGQTTTETTTFCQACRIERLEASVRLISQPYLLAGMGPTDADAAGPAARRAGGIRLQRPGAAARLQARLAQR